MSTVVLSQLAEDDLLEIWCSIATDNVHAADDLIDEVHAATKLLAQQPLMVRLRPEFGAKLRSFPLRGYVVFYRPAENGVAVARILHGARDLAQISMPEIDPRQ